MHGLSLQIDLWDSDNIRWENINTLLTNLCELNDIKIDINPTWVPKGKGDQEYINDVLSKESLCLDLWYNLGIFIERETTCNSWLSPSSHYRQHISSPLGVKWTLFVYWYHTSLIKTCIQESEVIVDVMELLLGHDFVRRRSTPYMRSLYSPDLANYRPGNGPSGQGRGNLVSWCTSDLLIIIIPSIVRLQRKSLQQLLSPPPELDSKQLNSIFINPIFWKLITLHFRNQVMV